MVVVKRMECKDPYSDKVVVAFAKLYVRVGMA